MSKNYTQNGGFGQRCKTFFALKGVVQPRCSCGTCWAEYFYRNPGKVAAAALALKEFGPDTIIEMQGTPYATECEVRETWELAMGLCKGRSNYHDVMVRRGRKYLKHIVQWLQANPCGQVSARTVAKHRAELANEVAA